MIPKVDSLWWYIQDYFHQYLRIVQNMVKYIHYLLDIFQLQQMFSDCLSLKENIVEVMNIVYFLFKHSQERRRQDIN